jgi:DNA-binding response OmpR family regulator
LRVPSPSSGPQPAARTPLPQEQLRVLVVDDDPDVVLTLMALLRDSGHDARAAYTGRSALVVANHFRPHAAFVDIKLPDISGWELARQLHREDRRRAPLLIATSGVYKQSADKILAKTVGFKHYVTKPYDPLALLALLEPLISGES